MRNTPPPIRKVPTLVGGRRLRSTRPKDATPVSQRRARFNFHGGGYDERDLTTTMTRIRVSKGFSKVARGNVLICPSVCPSVCTSLSRQKFNFFQEITSFLPSFLPSFSHSACPTLCPSPEKNWCFSMNKSIEWVLGQPSIFKVPPSARPSVRLSCFHQK